jgi:segregation and condensation protein A
MSAIGQGPGLSQIRYEDTPIEVWIGAITETLEFQGATTFQAIFAGRTDRSEVVGLFLALLELIRRQRIRAEQDRSFGTIYLFPITESEEAPAAGEVIAAASANAENVPVAAEPLLDPAAVTLAPLPTNGHAHPPHHPEATHEQTE